MSENNQIEKKFSIGKILEKFKSFFKFRDRKLPVSIEKNTDLEIKPSFDEYEKYFRFTIIFSLISGFWYVFHLVENTMWEIKYTPNSKIFLSLLSYVLCYFCMLVIFNKRDYLKYSFLFYVFFVFINIFITAFFICINFFIECDFSKTFFLNRVLIFIISPIGISYNYLSTYTYFFIFFIPILSVFFMFVSYNYNFKTKKYSMFVLISLIFVFTLLSDAKNLLSNCVFYQNCPRSYLSSLYRIAKEGASVRVKRAYGCASETKQDLIIQAEKYVRK